MNGHDFDPSQLREIGGHEVLQLVEEGGMSWVFEVRDPSLPNRRLALKLMKPEAGPVSELTRRFAEEADTMARLSHPCFLTLFNYGRDPGTKLSYYTMTFVDGPTLTKKVNKQGPLDLDTFAAVFLPVLDALALLHELPDRIIHRDVKPSNILLTSTGHPYLMDFGISREQDREDFTRTGIVIGSVLYMSPEQSVGRRVGPSTDVFSVGLTMYFALTGHIIYDKVHSLESATDQEVLWYLGHLQRNRPEEIDGYFAPEIPAHVRDVLARALRVAPDERYANARELQQALAAALRGEPDPMQLPSASAQPRARRLALASAGAAGAVALAAAGSLWFASRGESLTRLHAHAQRAGELEALLPSLELPPDVRSELALQLQQARAAYEPLAGESRASAVLARSVRDAFDRACSSASEALRLAIEHNGSALDERMQELRKRGASELAGPRWTQLAELVNQTLPAAPQPADDCSQALAEAGRARAAERAQAQLAELTPIVQNAAERKRADELAQSVFEKESRAIELGVKLDSTLASSLNEARRLHAQERWPRAIEAFRAIEASLDTALARGPNRKPELRVTTSRKRMRIGEEATIEAKARDLDGDDVRIEIVHRGQIVGSSEYAFHATRRGTEEFTVEASDGKAAVKQVVRIQVEAPEPSRVPPTSDPIPRPIGGEPRPAARSWSPPSGPWTDANVGLLTSHLADALQHCNREELQKATAGIVLNELTRICSGRAGVDVRYRKLAEPQPSGPDAYVTLVEESAEGRTRRLELTIGQREDGAWQIFLMTEEGR